MGFYVTEGLGGTVCECREKTHPPLKNRVVGSRRFSADRARRSPPQTLEPHREKQPTPTTTASGVRFYGYRYYSPELGRWPNRDPIGEKGGIHLYVYVRNGPTSSAVDFLGLAGIVYESYDVAGHPKDWTFSGSVGSHYVEGLKAGWKTVGQKFELIMCSFDVCPKTGVLYYQWAEFEFVISYDHEVITLPAWSDRAKWTKQNPDWENNWDNFREVIKTHELGHSKVFHDVFLAHQGEKLEVEVTDCDYNNLLPKIKKRLNEKSDEIFQEWNDANKAYHEDVGSRIVNILDMILSGSDAEWE